MSVNIKGMDEVLKKLEEKFSPTKVNRVVNKALKEGGQVFEKDLKEGLSTYADTGSTVDEVVVTSPRMVNGVKVVRVGFNGRKGRYALVHLNEFGYTRFGKRHSPKGLGVIRKTIDAGESKHQEIVKKVIVSELMK